MRTPPPKPKRRRAVKDVRAQTARYRRIREEAQARSVARLKQDDDYRAAL